MSWRPSWHFILALVFVGVVWLLIFNPSGFPGHTKDMARATQCLSNIKQQAMGHMLYASEYNEHLPTTKTWMDDVAPFVKHASIFQCPGFYNALRRAADGMKDAETGEFNGISTAYEIEAFPAFIPKSQRRVINASLVRQ